MAFEIELKAHIANEKLENVKDCFLNGSFSTYLGEIEKDDVYWGRPENTKKAVYRTRHELTKDGYRILFTAKPQKNCSQEGIENNTEVEFSAENDWNECLEFQKAIGFVVVRHKYKKGWHFEACFDGFDVHIEILDVKYLGYFLEMEICPEKLEGFETDKAVTALKNLVLASGLELADIEPRGYNDMLTECGHQLG